ncbi:MAG: CAP domain-containing protein [Spirochaetota bacterium]
MKSNLVISSIIIVLSFMQNACVQKIASCTGDVLSANMLNELMTTDSECSSDKQQIEDRNNLLSGLVLASASSAAASASATSCSNLSESSLTTEEASFHTLINEHRTSVGCSTLTYHAGLGGVARCHSEDMASNNYFSHDSQDGTSFSQRITNAGVSYSSAAENIAAGSSAASSTLTQWLNSSGHKANIENCNLTHHGIGRAFTDSSSFGYYWTNVFATNPSSD